jgi:hypothetical protein
MLRMLPALSQSAVFRGAFAVEGGTDALARIICAHSAGHSQAMTLHGAAAVDADAEVVAALSGTGAAQQHLAEIAAATQAVICMTDAASVR